MCLAATSRISFFETKAGFFLPLVPTKFAEEYFDTTPDLKG